MESFQSPRLPAPSCLSEALTNLSTSLPLSGCLLCPGLCPGRLRQKLTEMPPQSPRALSEYQSWSIRQCPFSLRPLHYYWCGGMRLLNAFNPNSDQAIRGDRESLGRYLAVTGDWTSCYDPFASQTCINPLKPSHSQPRAKSSAHAVR